MVMTALVGICPFPAACAVAVAKGQKATEGARHEVNGPVVVTTDCGTLIFGERKSALVKDVKRTASMTAAVLPACLAEVVEEGGDSNAVRGDTSRTCGYVFIDLKGVLCKPAVLLVMPVATAAEVVGGLKVSNDGVDAGTPGGTENAEDTVFGVVHSHLCWCSVYIYRKAAKFFQPASRLSKGDGIR